MCSEHLAQVEFSAFVSKYAKSYEAHELPVRFQNFQKQLDFVLEHNAKNSSWQAALNEFSDLGDEEFWGPSMADKPAGKHNNMRNRNLKLGVERLKPISEIGYIDCAFDLI